MADKIVIAENSTVDNIDINYMGDIEYKQCIQYFSSGEQIDIKDIVENPIDYSIAKDVFSIVTENKTYDEVFNDIREENQGLNQSSSNLQINALALNDYSGFQELSATQEQTANTDYIIALSDSLIESTISSNLVVYSFSSKVRYGFGGVYWVYNNGTLSSDNNPQNFTDDHYFYFKFIDENFCNVIKKLSVGEKYLTYNTSEPYFTFEDIEDETNSRFIYSYNSKNNQIFLGTRDGKAIGFDLVGELSAVPNDSFINDDNNSFRVDNKNALNAAEPIINSFLPYYGIKNNFDAIFEVDNISLYTHNYNSNIEKNSNFVPLKSNVIYDEKYSLVNTEQDVFFRQYTSLNSGIRGDSGYNNFILGYNTEWYKFDFKSDKQTYFNVPFELGKGYSQINVNDCKLIENGAIGGNSPLNSDKIYKKLFEYTDFRNTGETTDVDNSKYLCSWLWYNPLYPSQSKWLDRYYNPDVVAKYDALSESGWNTLSSLESFSTSNNLGGVYENYYKQFDRSVGVFDVESKLTIQSNGLYIYERLGKETSELLYNELSSFKLDSKQNVNLDFTYTDYLLTDTAYGDEEFCLNISLKDFDIDNFKGNKIFGNRTMSLTVDKDFSPYNIVVDNSIIKYYDFDYNYITELDLGKTIDDIIFTDDFNKFYVDCDGVLYTIESLNFITNETDTLSGNDNISDIKYYNQKLYVLDSSTNSISSYSPELDVLSSFKVATNDLLIINDGDIYTGDGDYIDYSDNNNIYTLSSDAIYYNNISTPVISSENGNFLDFYVDYDNILYVLKDDCINKVSNKTLAKLVKSVEITPTYSLKSMNVIRYQRNGVIHEYIDVYDKSGSDVKVHRYDKDLTLIDTIEKNISGEFILNKARLNTKFLDKTLAFKATLFDIFNYNERGQIELEIDKRYIDESNEPVINFIFSNKFGTITTYFNGNLIDVYKFDENKFYFSNTLRDNKIFIGGSTLNDEQTIDSVVLSSNNDMISGDFTIQDISIFNKLYNYYDVINYNRLYKKTPEASLIVPIKKRSYIEEIAGFYNQNKNMRKSEFSSINIYGTELTEEMSDDVFDKIKKLYEDTFVNLRLAEPYTDNVVVDAIIDDVTNDPFYFDFSPEAESGKYLVDESRNPLITKNNVNLIYYE